VWGRVTELVTGMMAVALRLVERGGASDREGSAGPSGAGAERGSWRSDTSGGGGSMEGSGGAEGGGGGIVSKFLRIE
jgi:hypothetical protein